MKKLVAPLLMIMVIIALSGCSNTADGAGKDIENMGRWVQNNS